MRKKTSKKSDKQAEKVSDTIKRWGIPETWVWTTVNAVGDVITGNTPSTKNRANYGNDIPFVKPPLLVDRGIYDAPEGLSKQGMASARVLPLNSVLVSCIGNLGKTGISKLPVAFNQQINAIIFSNDVIPKYAFYYTQTLKNWLYSIASATTLPIVNKSKFQKAPIPIAPVNEQKRIVAEIEKQFSRLDEAVDNLKRVKANLKRYKASVLKAAVEGKLTEEWRAAHPDVEPADKLLQCILAERRKKWEEAECAKMKGKGKVPKDDKWKKKYKEPAEPGLDDLPILPKEWKWVTWDTILAFDKGAFKRGPFGSSLKKSIFVDSGYKVYEQYCPINDDCSFSRYFITEEKYKELEAFAVKAGDFLISCSGTLGRITQVPNDYEAGIINQALLRVRVNNDVMYDFYFKMLFRSPHFQKQILANTTGSAITNVKGVNELKAIPLPLPILEEQKEIITILEEYMSVISVFDRQVDKNLRRAERLRQSVLKKAFSGKLVPQDADNESAVTLLKKTG